MELMDFIFSPKSFLIAVRVRFCGCTCLNRRAVCVFFKRVIEAYLAVTLSVTEESKAPSTR